MDPIELKKAVGSGLLSFPVTHFDSDLKFDEGVFSTNKTNRTLTVKEIATGANDFVVVMNVGDVTPVYLTLTTGRNPAANVILSASGLDHALNVSRLPSGWERATEIPGQS